MDKEKLTEFLYYMPKVELHIHLEGSIPVNALWELVKKYDRTGDVKSIDELKRKFEYKDFPHFIETWVWKNRFLREYDDFELIADEAAAKLAGQNIKYAEMFFSAPDFVHRGLNPIKITESVYKGISRHKEKITINLVADLVRDFGPAKGMNMLKTLNEVRSLNIIGVGIGGSEQEFPPGVFSEVYEKARELGFRTSAHAGEAAGAESIWSAVKDLKVDRIGHGTRAIEDPELVEYLREHKVPVEMCPISNVKTGVVQSIEKHPLKDYFEKGLNVFVNTDDPEMFNNTMADEYAACFSKLGFTTDDIKKLGMNAINSAWCDDENKIILSNELSKYFENL